jgi:phytanoyl-CoA hydroxylase
MFADPDAFDLAPALTHFAEHGYARLGRWATDDTLAGLRERIDAIMLGTVPNADYFFQHDSTSGRYEDLAYGKGWIGPSLDYRKVEKLERDDRFAAWMRNRLFERIAHTLIEAHVTLYRALLFGKSASGGTELPWHQDGGVFWGLDREPFLQLWTALDDAPPDGGCLEFLPGSHHAGLATPDGGVVPPAHLLASQAEARAVAVPVVAGEVVMIHNHVWHRSRRNLTGRTRRAFTLCLLDGRTNCRRRKRAPRAFPLVFAAKTP